MSSKKNIKNLLYEISPTLAVEYLLGVSF